MRRGRRGVKGEDEDGAGPLLDVVAHEGILVSVLPFQA